MSGTIFEKMKADGQIIRNKRAQLVVALGLAGMFMGSTLLTPLYELYRRTFGFSELVLTLVYSVYVVGNLGALLFLGRLSDQIGRKRTCLPAIGGACVCAAIFFCARGPTWLFAGRLVSGLSIGLASGTTTAWIADLSEGPDRSRASMIAATANFAGIAAGPLLTGVLAQYAPAPLHLTYVAYLITIVVIGFLLARTRETIRSPARRLSEVSLRPRIGVPRELWSQFVSPAVAIFAIFAMVGFYAALAPGLLRRDLHQTNLAVSGAVVGEMFLAGTVAIPLTQNLPSRRAMLGSLAFVLVALGVVALAERLHSMPVLLAGTGLAGASAAVGYRGGLQVVNQIAPANRRAEVISSYLVVGFLGNAVPVIGVGLMSLVSRPITADAMFAALIAALAIVALATGAKLVPKSAPA